MLVDQNRLSIVPGTPVLLYQEEGLWLVCRLILQILPGVANLPQDAARHAVQPVEFSVLRSRHYDLAKPKAVGRLSPAR